MVKKRIDISGLEAHLTNLEKLKNLPAILKEEQILLFFRKNRSAVNEILPAEGFFPGTDPDQVLKELLGRLREKSLKEIRKSLKPVLEKETDFSVLVRTQELKPEALDSFREKLGTFLDIVLSHHEARFRFYPILRLLKSGLLEKYIRPAFEEGSALSRALLQEEPGLKEPSEHADYLKILLLLKNAAFVRAADREGRRAHFGELKNDRMRSREFLRVTERRVARELPGLEGSVIRKGLFSNAGSGRTKPPFTGSRLLYILCHYAPSYGRTPAESGITEGPDKSWFLTGLQNAGFFGFDRTLLEELAAIAGRNNW